MKKMILYLSIISFLLTFNISYAKMGLGKSSGFRSYKSFKYSKPKSSIKRSQKENINIKQMKKQGRKTPPFFNNPIFKWVIGGLIFGALLSLFMGYGLHFGPPGLLEILIIGGLIYYIYKRFKSSKRTSREHTEKKQKDNSSISIEEQVDEKFLKNFVKNLYIKLQNEWSKGDLTTVKNLLTDRLYNHLEMQLLELSGRGLRNIIDNIKIHNVDIIHIEDLPDGNKLVVAELEVEMIDYITNSKGRVISGNPDEPKKVKEYWAIIGKALNWKLDDIRDVKE